MERVPFDPEQHVDGMAYHSGIGAFEQGYHKPCYPFDVKHTKYLGLVPALAEDKSNNFKFSYVSGECLYRLPAYDRTDLSRYKVFKPEEARSGKTYFFSSTQTKVKLQDFHSTAAVITDDVNPSTLVSCHHLFYKMEENYEQH